MAVTFILVVLGWVLFRADSIIVAKEYYTILLGMSNVALWDSNMNFFVYEYGVFFVLAVVSATPILKIIINKVFENKKENKKESNIYFVLEMLCLTFLMYICTVSLIASDFNPFIYFNF